MLETDDRHRRLQALAEGFGFAVRKRVVPSLIEKGRVYYIVDLRNEVDCFGDFATLDEAEVFLSFLIGIRREQDCSLEATRKPEKRAATSQPLAA